MNTNPSDSTVMLQLTAYLDGELEGNEISQVEERLATDEQYRGLMQKLQQTWDVLDMLPKSQPNASFTQSTMKLVVGDAKDLVQKSNQNWWTWPLRILALLLVPAAASAGAYLAIHYVQDKPNRELEHDLQQIRDFDVYNNDKNVSIDFLEKLAEEASLFGVYVKDEMQSDERFQTFKKPPINLASLKTLGDDSKNQLRINRANFTRASSEDKERVAQLIDQIANHPKSASLREVLFQYNFWLKSIPESDEAELLDLKDTEKRIKKIKGVVESQIFNNFDVVQLNKQDFSVMTLMFWKLAQRRKDDIQRIYFENLDRLDVTRFAEIQWIVEKTNMPKGDQAAFQTGMLLKVLYKELPESIDSIVTQSDKLEIKSILSQDAKDQIEWALSWQPEQSESSLLTSWLIAAFEAKYMPNRPKNLSEFFKNLPMKVQDRLNNEYPQDRENALKEMYLQLMDQS